MLLPNQASSDHCYKVFQQGTDTQYWNKAAVSILINHYLQECACYF